LGLSRCLGNMDAWAREQQTTKQQSQLWVQQCKCLSEPCSSCVFGLIPVSSSIIIVLLSDDSSYLVLSHILPLTRITLYFYFSKMQFFYLSSIVLKMPMTLHWIFLINLWSRSYNHAYFSEEEIKT
jgi:hypothetical protein